MKTVFVVKVLNSKRNNEVVFPFTEVFDNELDAIKYGASFHQPMFDHLTVKVIERKIQ